MSSPSSVEIVCLEIGRVEICLRGVLAVVANAVGPQAMLRAHKSWRHKTALGMGKSFKTQLAEAEAEPRFATRRSRQGRYFHNITPYRRRSRALIKRRRVTGLHWAVHGLYFALSKLWRESRAPNVVPPSREFSPPGRCAHRDFAGLEGLQHADFSTEVSGRDGYKLQTHSGTTKGVRDR